MVQMHHVSYVAVVVAAIAAVLWGWLWHTCLCSKKWASECGMHHNMDKKQTRIATLVSFVAALLTAFVLHRLLSISQAANIMPDKTAYKYGLCVAFCVWIGFYVPMMLNATVWMKKTWRFFFVKIINTFITLFIMTMILAYWTQMNR